MKIALVCFNLGWQTGGPRVLFAQAQAMKKMGHTVVIYAPDFEGKYFGELWKGLDIRVVPPPGQLLWNYESTSLWFRVKQKFAQERLHARIAKTIAKAMDPDFDIVNGHDFGYKVFPFYRRRNSRAKLIWTMHDRLGEYLPKSRAIYSVLSWAFSVYKGASEKRYYGIADSVVVLTGRNKRWVEQELGLPAKIVWPGVAYDKYYAAPKKEIPRDKPVILLGVGAFNRYRRYDDLIGAAAILRKQGYDANALLICKDLWDARADKEEILALTVSLDMNDHVTFRFDGASEDELVRAYRESTVCGVTIYAPPPRDGYPWSMVIFEAMAAGTPTMVCKTNDVTEVLKDGEDAVFVDPMSPEDIAKKLKFLIEHPENYAKIAVAGQQFVKENLTWEKYAEGVLGSLSK